MVAKLCSRSQGHPSGPRSRAMIATLCSKSAPASVNWLPIAGFMTSTLTDGGYSALCDLTCAPFPVHRAAILPPEPVVECREHFRRNADHPDRLRVVLRPRPRQLSERLHQPPAAAS